MVISNEIYETTTLVRPSVYVLLFWTYLYTCVDVYRSAGDFPEQQCSPRPDPEMSRGLPRVQESHFPKVNTSEMFFIWIQFLIINVALKLSQHNMGIH